MDSDHSLYSRVCPRINIQCHLQIALLSENTQQCTAWTTSDPQCHNILKHGVGVDSGLSQIIRVQLRSERGR